MEYLAIAIIIIGYLATMAYCLKEAIYEKNRADHLARSNRELHAENQYYRNLNQEKRNAL